MKVIDTTFNKLFCAASTKPCVGFVTGPIRIIAAVAQIALNVLLIVTLIAPLMSLINRVKPLQLSYVLEDTLIGCAHIARGVAEFAPGTSFFIDKDAKGIALIHYDDRPFHTVSVDFMDEPFSFYGDL